jgi:DNA-binding MarR family transcriptional regulator
MTREEDLGALFSRITRRLIEAEQPLLEAHRLSMWEYVVLSALAVAPASSQLVLANRIGHDKTRLIPLLDVLVARDLVVRAPDPSDRRAHTVELTTSGRTLMTAVRRDIRAMERELLASLAPDQRATLEAVLPRLAGPRFTA